MACREVVRPVTHALCTPLCHNPHVPGPIERFWASLLLTFRFLSTRSGDTCCEKHCFAVTVLFWRSVFSDFPVFCFSCFCFLRISRMILRAGCHASLEQGGRGVGAAQPLRGRRADTVPRKTQSTARPRRGHEREVSACANRYNRHSDLYKMNCTARPAARAPSNAFKIWLDGDWVGSPNGSAHDSPPVPPV